MSLFAHSPPQIVLGTPRRRPAMGKKKRKRQGGDGHEAGQLRGHMAKLSEALEILGTWDDAADSELAGVLSQLPLVSSMSTNPAPSSSQLSARPEAICSMRSLSGDTRMLLTTAARRAFGVGGHSTRGNGWSILESAVRSCAPPIGSE